MCNSQGLMPDLAAGGSCGPSCVEEPCTPTRVAEMSLYCTVLLLGAVEEITVRLDLSVFTWSSRIYRADST